MKRRAESFACMLKYRTFAMKYLYNMKTRALLSCSFLICLTGCNTNVSRTEIIQKHRDLIVDVSESIVDIKTEILLGSSYLYIIDDILVVADMSHKADRCIHLFNKNSFDFSRS